MSAKASRRAGTRHRGAAARPAAAAPGAGSPGRWLAWACWFAPPAAFAALLWSLRGAPLGTPVADDFEFIGRVVFHGGRGLLDSMGASYYWRPLSRQAWFPLVTPLLLAAPAFVAALHVAILGATAFVLARIARRFVPAAGAALVGAAVLATEPARVLLAWPSGIQHLLAALGLALAAHEALAGRRWTAALAAVAAALSHELGVLAFAFVALGGFARRVGRAAWLDVALAVALAGGYAFAYRAALGHGVQLPAGGPLAASAWLGVARLGLAAAFDAETLPGYAGGPVVAASELVVLGALLLLLLPARRGDLRRVAPPAAVALAIGWLGLLPLASLLPDWNSWRAFVPGLAIVLAAVLVAARAHVALALALVAIRIAALAAAEPAPRVRGTPPPAVSDLSFARLARMQRVVAASRDVVRAARLPRGARVAYLTLPEMTMNGFRSGRALQVWTRDTSARFVAFDLYTPGPDSTDLVVAYDVREGRPLALVLDPEAYREWRQAQLAADAGRYDEARALYERARARQRPECPSLTAKVLQNLSVFAVADGEYATADSLNHQAALARGPTPEGYAIDALIAARRGDPARARAYLGESLRLSPGNPLALAVRAEVEKAAAEQRPPAP